MQLMKSSCNRNKKSAKDETHEKIDDEVYGYELYELGKGVLMKPDDKSVPFKAKSKYMVHKRTKWYELYT